MSKDIFIGIDGGATKCKARVEDADGNLIGQGVGGPANIRLSVDLTWQSICQTLDIILAPQQISLYDKSYRFHAGLGLAGCEVKEARQTFLNTPNPFATYQLVSDAHTACLGAHGGKDGAIIIVGTGVVGYEILQGAGSKVGGWGFPHDDEGGGAWLGLEAVRLTFQWLDQRGDKSALLEDVYAYFDRDLTRFVSWANQATSNEFARLAPMVINHSLQQDVHATRLMKKAALAVNRVGAALEKKRQQHDTPLACSLSGGIAPFLEPWLGEDLKSRLMPRIGDANTGAILMIRNHLTSLMTTSMSPSQ